ncbi:unnamed protein product [Linum trigynum]|uniref:IST1-like protein n=1 Tax=Linum trigynum TaxID=586398 RepID=A0AAV2EXD3_9ROSI
MIKKLQALLGKSFKASRYKTLSDLVISRIAYLERQHKARCSQARDDVAQLLAQGHLDRALLRVEHAIREQNVLDSYAMIENYCHLISERLIVVETHSKECPEELKEAISSLIFAAARCGDLPELQEMKRLFTSRYGKEFTARATELRNHCGVHPGMANKLSTRQPSLESKIKALKEIAPKSELITQIEEAAVSTTNPKPAVANHRHHHHHHHLQSPKSLNTPPPHHPNNKYKDFETAAHAAFELSAQAATAARAAMELSRPPASGGSSSDTNGGSGTLVMLGRSSSSSTGKSTRFAASKDYVPKLFNRSASVTMLDRRPPNIGR